VSTDDRSPNLFTVFTINAKRRAKGAVDYAYRLATVTYAYVTRSLFFKTYLRTDGTVLVFSIILHSVQYRTMRKCTDAT